MSTESPAAEDDALPFLLGTGFGALLHQRDCLTLHAATVSFDGRGVALCGVSGVGKSTLAAALCCAGCELVSDDVTAIHFDAADRVFAWPDGRQHRLWADSVEHLSVAERQGRPVRENFKKFHVDPQATAGSASVPLVAVVALSATSWGQPVGLVPLSLPDAASRLRKDVYRS